MAAAQQQHDAVGSNGDADNTVVWNDRGGGGENNEDMYHNSAPSRSSMPASSMSSPRRADRAARVCPSAPQRTTPTIVKSRFDALRRLNFANMETERDKMNRLFAEIQIALND